VLEDPAFGAVVVDRMRGAAGYRRRIEVMIVIACFTGMLVSIHGMVMAAEVEDDPGQRTERRPRERYERAGNAIKARQRRRRRPPTVGSRVDRMLSVTAPRTHARKRGSDTGRIAFSAGHETNECCAARVHGSIMHRSMEVSS
jgi:hypothetical protein